MIGPQFAPNRAGRRAALKTLRHNTVLYHAEMDRIRALHSARQAGGSAVGAAALVPVGLVPGVKIGAGTIRVRLTKDSAEDAA